MGATNNRPCARVFVLATKSDRVYHFFVASFATTKNVPTAPGLRLTLMSLRVSYNIPAIQCHRVNDTSEVKRCSLNHALTNLLKLKKDRNLILTMAGHTVPIDFRVNPAKITNPVERKTLLQDLLPVVEPFTGALSEVSVCEVPGGNYVALYASDKMTFSVKLYGNGVVSASVEYYTDEVNEHKIVNDDGRRLERQLREKFGCTIAKVLPALKRAPLINPYFTSSDDRILEYDVDKLIFEKQSDFQKVQILHTLSFGNMLLLDDLQNLAESDLPYTHGLMNKENEDFEGKEILILGGGDGALLWELLKEKPKFVTMIDIDNVVMEACRKHMRSVCGDCMDNYDGSNYKIIVGDAIAYMEDYIKEKKSFDYVFGDLTDVPISPTPQGKLWDFIQNIINRGTKLLKPGTGKYMTHAIGIGCESALKMFEEQFSSVEVSLSINRTSRFVPSFMENWCFYQATRSIEGV